MPHEKASFAQGEQHIKGDIVSDFDIGDEDVGPVDQAGEHIFDPWESFNRKMFHFNDWVYRHLFNPLADGYDRIMPLFLQKRIKSVARFSRTPERLFNNLFQGKMKRTSVEFGRLVVNSSFGLAGIFDPAQHFFGWEPYTEDVGQTLGHYGMSEGRYLVLPFLGPSNTRDLIGRIGDLAFSPFVWFGIYDVESQTAFQAFTGTERVNSYAYDTRGNYKSVTEDAIDPYASLRHVYTELRAKQIKE